MPLIHVDDRQHACILAALRTFQFTPQDIPVDAMASIEVIETNDGKLEGLTDDEIDALCEAINCSPDKAPPLAIILEGGLVQSVVSTKPEVFGNVYIIDYDTEGADADEVYMVPQAKGKDEEAVMRGDIVEAATINLPETIRRFDAAETGAKV